MMKLILMVSSMMVMTLCCDMVSFYILLCLVGSFFMFYGFKFDLLDNIVMIYSDYLYVDKNSYPLVVLTLWILGLMFMSIVSVSGEGSSKILVFIFMLLILLVFFSSSNLLIMYLFFELSLIPTYLLIIYWGANPERLSASFYLLVYMLLISLPLLFYIYYLMISFGSLSFVIYNSSFLKLNLGWWDYLIMVGAFLIKLPVYIFHVWLPKAHVEAPVYGSMILAAVLLKLGGYGLYRVMMCLKFSLSNHLPVISVGLIGGVLVSFLSMIQVDMKSLVAYSSVVHMNLMLVGLMTMMGLGWSSTMMIMISHGVCSSGLFYMVNMYYERSFSRLLLLNKGSITYLPVVSIWWFLLCSSNFSFPLSLNFIGEITLLMTLLSWMQSLMVIMILACFFSGAYSLYLFSYVHYGQSSYAMMSGSGSIKEILVVMYHYIPLVFILLNLFMFY